ncbi:polysaccharide deacetylase [Nitrosomonas sp.]|uniref:polysaccharide deacetylase n=1 Tax=Nitrosomonas sp. TaxID=42353 RepID=UPI0033058AFF
MNVLFTFDVEIWCNSWSTLDEDFPASFDRYVFGRSAKGEYALPKILDTLGTHGLKGVFFVEPLFAAHFGVEYLKIIVRLIQDAGQEVQLHLHPEWTDEARDAPLLENVTVKRQHLTQYSIDEQQVLIKHGLRLLQEAGCIPPPVAFRSGSFSCNEDTFSAVTMNGLRFDSSINPQMEESQPGDIAPVYANPYEVFTRNELTLIPMSSFCDGFGQNRHAQIGACSAREITQALEDAVRKQWHTFVLLSHGFELMVPGRNTCDPFVERRFTHVCRFLAANRLTMPTVNFSDLSVFPDPCNAPLPAVRKLATVRRYAEQALRRLYQ